MVGRELSRRDRVAVVDGGDEAGAEGLEAAVDDCFGSLFLCVGGGEKEVSLLLLFFGLAPFRLSLSPNSEQHKTPLSLLSPSERCHVPRERPQARRGVVGDVAK